MLYQRHDLVGRDFKTLNESIKIYNNTLEKIEMINQAKAKTIIIGRDNQQHVVQREDEHLQQIQNLK